MKLGISLRHELDDERPREAREELRDPRQRQVVRDGEMMHERQRQHEVGRSAIGKGVAFLVCPSRPRARVGEVEQEWQQVLLATFDDPSIVLLHRDRVHVERDSVNPAIASEAAEGAIIGAQVPDAARTDVIDCRADDLPLVAKGGIGVIRSLVIVSPRGFGRPPRQSHDGAFEAVEDACRRRGTHGRRPPLLHARATGGHAPFSGGLQMHVRQDAGTKPRARRQQTTCQFKRHAVQLRTEELEQAAVHVAHHRERGQEQLAELSVCDPRLARRQPLERERVNPDRPSSLERNVVGRRVLERESVLHCRLLKAQREKRRVLQLTETPFVKIGNKRHTLRLQDQRSPAVGRNRRIDLLMPHGIAGLHELVVQPRGHKGVVVCPSNRIDLAEKLAVPRENESGGISKGGSVRRIAPVGALRTSSVVTRHQRPHRGHDAVPVRAQEEDPTEDRAGDHLEHVAGCSGIYVRLSRPLADYQQ